MIVETSMSAIKSFTECRKRYYYDYVVGLKPKAPRKAMNDGTRIHNLLEAGYLEWMRDCGAGFMDRVHAQHIKDCEHSPQDPETEQMYLDVVTYYWEHVGQHDLFNDILLVETPVKINVDGISIRCTFDLLVRQEGMLKLIDHKTTGVISEEISFMSLDFQLRMYSYGVQKMYGEPASVLHNMLRRAVPKELTKTGKKSTASKEVRDYLRREPLYFAPNQLAAFEDELRLNLSEMRRAHATNAFPRSPSKAYTGCAGCAYRNICEADYAGRPVDVQNAGVQLLFNVAADPLSKT